MDVKVLFSQSASREAEKTRMSDYVVVPDLTDDVAVLVVHVKRYSDQVVILSATWGFVDTEPHYGGFRRLLDVYVQDFVAIRQGIATFDYLVHDKFKSQFPDIQGDDVTDYRTVCQFLPGHDTCAACRMAET